MPVAKAPKPNCRKCHDTGVLTEFHRIEPLNPNSPPQVLNLMKAHKLKIPRKRGEDHETTESKYLRRFGKKHLVFKHILDFRQRTKLISNYIWELDAEDCVRTTIGYHPSTWRKSSRKPNLQVIPTRATQFFCDQCSNIRPEVVYDKQCPCGGRFTTLAEMVRATINAPPGWMLTEADSEGIEAVLVAYAVGDAKMMKVCKAGPHGYFMSHTQGRGLSPDLPFAELKAACKKEKKHDPQLYDTHKRTIHGTHYGLTPYGMVDEFEEVFHTQANATKMQNSYLALWPVFAQWMQRTRQQAYSQRYLDNHFDYRHYFYNVFTWDSKRRQHVLGEDGKRCIAFIPQSDASAIQTEYILEVEDRGEQDEGYRALSSWFCLPVHDSLIFMHPKSEERYVPQAIADVMNMPFAELGGLRIGVEVKQGENLRDTSVVNINQVEWEEGAACD